MFRQRKILEAWRYLFGIAAYNLAFEIIDGVKNHPAPATGLLEIYARHAKLIHNPSSADLAKFSRHFVHECSYGLTGLEIEQAPDLFYGSKSWTEISNLIYNPGCSSFFTRLFQAHKREAISDFKSRNDITSLAAFAAEIDDKELLEEISESSVSYVNGETPAIK